MATFSVRAPPNPSPRRLWPGQAGQSLTSPSCLPSPSPEGPQSMVNFSGDFLGESLALPSKCFGTPQKIRAKIRATSVQTILASNPCRNPRKKIGPKNAKESVQKIRAKNPCKKSVQKIRAKNPCRKSVQKIRAKNLCETNPCKRLPQSNIAN